MFNFTFLLTGQWGLLVFVGSLTSFVFYVKYKHSHWRRFGVPGPKPVFLLGNSASLFSKPLHEAQIDNYKEFGKIYGSYHSLNPVLTVGDPKHLADICIKHFHVFPQSFPILGWSHPIQEGFLVSIWGERWKRIRSIISPTFTSSKMRKMFSLIVTCNQSLRKQLASITSPGLVTDFDPKDYWGKYNLDVIGRCCFASDLDVYDHRNQKMIQKLVDVNEIDVFKLFLVFILPLRVAQFFRVTVANVHGMEYLRDLTFSLMKEREKSDQKPNDFVQALIELSDGTDLSDAGLQGRLTKLEVVSNCILFLIAGYETTSTLLTWACYRLALNPVIQEKLVDEVSNVDLNDHEVVSGLPYLNAVINETLRIDPPGVVLNRVAHEDYALPGTEIFIPKGTYINIPVYAIHHDPDNYPEPETFDPERFNFQPPKPFTFIPFGIGQRSCLGMRFALANAKLALASFIRDYKVSVTPKTPKEPEYEKGTIILTAKELLLGIEPRGHRETPI